MKPPNKEVQYKTIDKGFEGVLVCVCVLRDWYSCRRSPNASLIFRLVLHKSHGLLERTLLVVQSSFRHHRDAVLLSYCIPFAAESCINCRTEEKYSNLYKDRCDWATALQVAQPWLCTNPIMALPWSGCDWMWLGRPIILCEWDS